VEFLKIGVELHGVGVVFMKIGAELLGVGVVHRWSWSWSWSEIFENRSGVTWSWSGTYPELHNTDTFDKNQYRMYHFQLNLIVPGQKKGFI